MNILLIDDETSFHSIIILLSKKLNFKPITCRSKKELIGLLGKEKIHIALIDYNLPLTTGDEILQILKENDPETKCYLFTSDNSQKLKNIKFAEGFLDKSDLVRQLPAIIKKYQSNT